ncbi:hypothetical protein V9T40_010633 [Parthenolecanium corni]|uniref:Uncharacterized protein n=1 Tax=Parthenolecanium corni TaxID=536013 RepID=A0AAN9TH31_9HEMI
MYNDKYDAERRLLAKRSPPTTGQRMRCGEFDSLDATRRPDIIRVTGGPRGRSTDRLDRNAFTGVAVSDKRGAVTTVQHFVKRRNRELGRSVKPGPRIRGSTIYSIRLVDRHCAPRRPPGYIDCDSNLNFGADCGPDEGAVAAVAD